jgi:hypothetical protein
MKELLIPRNAPLAHAERIVPEKAIPPFMDLLCAQSDLRISIFDWTFANLHVKLLPGVRFRSKDCERLLHNRAQRFRLGTHASRHVKPFIPGVALLKKILDFGLGRIGRLSLIADTARVPRCKYRKEGE